MQGDGSDGDIESAATRLVGRTIEDVRYWDLPGAEQVSEWPPEVAHRASHGVDLVGADFVTAVTWGKEFTSWNLSIRHDSLVDFLLAGQFERVHDKTPWSTIVGRPVVDSRVHWLTEQRGSYAITFPFALELRFSADEFVVLAAASYHDPGRMAFPGGDDIVIAWQPDHIRNVLPDLIGPLNL